MADEFDCEAMTAYYLKCKGVVAAHPMEWDIYKALDADGFTQQTIMSLYRKVING